MIFFFFQFYLCVSISHCSKLSSQGLGVSGYSLRLLRSGPFGTFPAGQLPSVSVAIVISRKIQL